MFFTVFLGIPALLLTIYWVYFKLRKLLERPREISYLNDPAPYAIVEYVSKYGITPEERELDTYRNWADKTSVRASFLTASRWGRDLIGVLVLLLGLSVGILIALVMIFALVL